MKNAMIIVKGTGTSSGEEPEVIEVTSFGKMDVKDGKIILLYDDAQTYTRLEFAGQESFVIIRTGAVESRMEITLGRMSLADYTTEFGSMMLTLFGEKIENKLTEKGGTFYARYSLDSDLASRTKSELEITVKLTE